MRSVSPALPSSACLRRRQRSAAGACLAALIGVIPVSVLEPALAQDQPSSIFHTLSDTERQGSHKAPPPQTLPLTAK